MNIKLEVGEQEYDAIQGALAYFGGVPLRKAIDISAKSTKVALGETGIARLRIELERQREQEERNPRVAHVFPPVPAGDVDFDERLSG